MQASSKKAYNSQRKPQVRHLLCHAPVTNINFTQNGDMLACCYNRLHPLGQYPIQSVKEAWYGSKAEELRNYIREENLGGGCSNCLEIIESGNILGAKSIYYDDFAEKKGVLKRLLVKNEKIGFPKVFEFEISNHCNLECTMCTGYFSSAIRKNREKLPKMHNPYDDAFIAEIKEFLPHLTEAKFLGGEPFLIHTYYKIWDIIIEENLSLKIQITTNGTVLNDRVKRYLDKLNADIVISIDSLDEKNYERIRKNANFKTVERNIEWFIQYSQEKNRFLGFSICPMVSNWQDIPSIISFCNQKDIGVHFNTVWSPEHESLQNLKRQQMHEFMESLNRIEFPNSKKNGFHNKRRTMDLIKQLESIYHSERIIRRDNHIAQTIEGISIISSIPDSAVAKLSQTGQTIFRALVNHYAGQAGNIYFMQPVTPELESIIESDGDQSFFEAMKECYILFSVYCLHPDMHKNFEENIHLISVLTLSNHTISELNQKTLRGFDFFNQFYFLAKSSLEEVKKSMNLNP